MGRRPDSKKAIELKGNPRQLKVIKDHPSTGAADVDPPDWLDRTGKAYWRKIVPTLKNAGLFNAGDEESLSMLCQAYSDYRECVAALRKEGKIIVSNTGAVKPHPLVAMTKQYADQHTRLSGEFGLTPAARSKMTLEPVEEIDPLDDFLGKTGT